MNKEREIDGIKIVVNGEQYEAYKGTLQEQIEELEKELKEADEAVEYWQKECGKRSKILDKIKEYIKENACYDKDIKQCCRDLLTDECDYVLELLEEIE